MRKRRFGRLQKARGDVALLAGSPADASEHYGTAVELLRPSQDFVYCAAALEGRAHALVRVAGGEWDVGRAEGGGVCKQVWTCSGGAGGGLRAGVGG